LNERTPRSLKRSPEPTTRSLTVLDASTSPGSASVITRAPMWTAIPATSCPTSSHSPVCSPARIRSPISPASSTISAAQRTARAGPSNVARKPSPIVLTSVPRHRSSWVRTSALCSASSSRQRPSPSREAVSVEPTMSVNITVASTRSACSGGRRPVRNSSMSSIAGASTQP